MNTKQNGWFTGALLLFVSGAALAEDPAAAPPKLPGPSFADVSSSSGLSASGYIAASFYHSNGLPANIHQFDVQHDTLQLDQAGLQVAYQPKAGFGGLLDLIAGEDARILHAAEDGHDNSFDVRQAFMQYSTGPVTVIAGKFLTLAGAEVINPTANTNFSRSLLFYESQPLTHTGIRATYALSDTLSLIGGVNNGWNITSTSYGSKTGEVGIAWTPSKLFSLTSQAYFGKIEALDAEKTLIDVVATYNVTSALILILNFDWNEQKLKSGTLMTATWYGSALYANYAIDDKWRVSARAEYLDDKDAFLSGTQQTLKEGTITLGYAPVKSFELRMEGRYDAAQNRTFFRSKAALAGAVPDSANLTGIALQGVYKF
ncbi:MAG: porin [Pseudomonadota bacterium]|nr:porin [Pseudomonadota bacterium]